MYEVGLLEDKLRKGFKYVLLEEAGLNIIEEGSDPLFLGSLGLEKGLKITKENLSSVEKEFDSNRGRIMPVSPQALEQFFRGYNID